MPRARLATVTRGRVAGIEVASTLLFCSSNRASRSVLSSASRPSAPARLDRVHGRRVVVPEGSPGPVGAQPRSRCKCPTQAAAEFMHPTGPTAEPNCAPSSRRRRRQRPPSCSSVQPAGRSSTPSISAISPASGFLGDHLDRAAGALLDADPAALADSRGRSRSARSGRRLDHGVVGADGTLTASRKRTAKSK